MINDGERYRLTRDTPCFWFADTPYAFELRWPSDGHQKSAPPPKPPNPSEEGRGSGEGRGRKRARRQSGDGGGARQRAKDGGGSCAKSSRYRQATGTDGQQAEDRATLFPRLPSSDGAQRGGRLKVKRKRKKRGLSWPDSPLIGGSPPRGAGVIALSKGLRGQQNKRLYVCLVIKRTGIESFPKGARRQSAAETVL